MELLELTVDELETIGSSVFGGKTLRGAVILDAGQRWQLMDHPECSKLLTSASSDFVAAATEALKAENRGDSLSLSNFKAEMIAAIFRMESVMYQFQAVLAEQKGK